MMVEIIGFIGAIGGLAYVAEKAFHALHQLCDAIIGKGDEKNAGSKSV